MIDELKKVDIEKDEKLVQHVVDADRDELVTFLENLVVRVDDLESTVRKEPRGIQPLVVNSGLPQVITKINEIISKLRLN